MFKERLISGVILVIIALISGVMGGPIFLVITCGVSIIGLYELFKIVEIENGLPGHLGYLATILYYLCIYWGIYTHLTMLSIGFLIVLMMAYVFTFPSYKPEQIITAYFGFFYVTVMLSYAYLTRELPTGIFTLWLVFLCSWGCDTCAYCVGMLFGKRKLAPILSPKKSVEGAVGGVVGAALLGGVYAICVNKFSDMEVSAIMYALICANGAMISMIGDLAASAIKRDKGVKDYGNLIPGHGGILDRFDSVIFTAPVIYYLALYLM